MIPVWLSALSALMIASGILSAVWIGWDVRKHPQKMWTMAMVWPLTRL